MRMRTITFLFALVFLMSMAATAQQDSTSTDETPQHRGLMLYYMRGTEAESAGQTEDARQAFLDGQTVFPGSPHMALGVARTSAALGDEKSCLEALDHLAALGGKFDLTRVEALKPFLEKPEFQKLAEALKPVEPAAPGPESVHTLQDADLWNEGIACDRVTGDLFAGSIKHPKIVRLRNGVQEDFGTTAQDDLLEVIGLHVDEKRRQLWACTGRDEPAPSGKHDFGEMPRENAMVVYDLDTGKQIRKFTLVPDDRIHMWNDVTVALDGTAYFTDMSVSEIYRIPPDGSPELFYALEDRNYPNGIAAGLDGRLVYVACLEEILVIDAASGKASALKSGADVCTGLGDGIALNEDGLFIVQNSGLLGMRVLHCRLDESGHGLASAHAINVALPPGLMPYTCALGRDLLYVNGTAPFSLYDEPDDPPASVIVEIPITRSSDE